MLYKKKIAVVLSGCGVYDGVEIHEAVLTMLAIKRHKADYVLFAPDIDQYHVIDHYRKNVVKETRNVLVESARIARGNIQPLSRFLGAEHDGLILPGGFGAVKNLCDWAVAENYVEVEPDVERSIKIMIQSGKPVGAMCISPVIFARLFTGLDLTTGKDEASRKFIEKRGNNYIETTHGEVIINKEKKILTTPCYMLDADITDIAASAENLVVEMLKMIPGFSSRPRPDY
ncbi:MAG: isoprenoid biosynthesis glyoxalase ElbB [Bacteroidota bacterium]